MWDRTPEATAPLVALGAVAAESARDAVADARVVITMLSQWHSAVDAGHGREDVSVARLALGK